MYILSQTCDFHDSVLAADRFFAIKWCVTAVDSSLPWCCWSCNKGVMQNIHQQSPRVLWFCMHCQLYSPITNLLHRVHVEGQQLRHDPNPVYLGVTLDRILSYRQHLTKTAGKLQSRNNLLMKLAGSSWGANDNTLRSSALALCYSVAEYCCPVWQRSTHVSLVDA